MNIDTRVTRCVRRRGNGLNSVFAVVCLAGLTLLSIGTTVAVAEVVLTQQEILDALRGGIEQNNTPEDIQQHLDGLNEAVGGSGQVPLPLEIHSVETRDGRATLTETEANRYQTYTDGLARQHPPDTSGLRALRADSARWAVWQRADLVRTIVAAAGLTSLQAEFDEDMAAYDREAATIEQEPTRYDYGPAYERYSTYEEAMESWRNRADALANSDVTRSEAVAAFETRIARMLDPNEESLDFTSMANRPTVRMRQIGREMDSLRNAAALYEDSLQLFDQLMRAIEARTQRRRWVSELSGSRGQAPTEWGENGSSSEESVDDLLKEFGADDEGDDDSGEEASGGRTELVNEEILADIQRKFDAAVYDFERCYSDFEGQLNSLAGQEPEVVCGNATLASSYACVEDQFYYIAGYYDEAHDRISEADSRNDWVNTGMESDILPEGQTGVSPMDQITITLINSKYDRVSETITVARDMLASQAPGCDPDDLRNAGTLTSGDDDDGDSGGGDDRGSGSWDGNGDGDSGGGDVAEGVHFRKIMAPSTHGSTTTAHCTGGTLNLKSNGMPDFPDEVWPGQSYTVELNLSWNTQGNSVEDVEIFTSAFFMDPANLKKEEYNAFSASGLTSFTFGTGNVDFSREGGVITVIYGGSIDCEDDSGETGGTVIVQAYERVGN